MVASTTRRPRQHRNTVTFAADSTTRRPPRIESSTRTGCLDNEVAVAALESSFTSRLPRQRDARHGSNRRHVVAASTTRWPRRSGRHVVAVSTMRSPSRRSPAAPDSSFASGVAAVARSTRGETRRGSAPDRSRDRVTIAPRIPSGSEVCIDNFDRVWLLVAHVLRFAFVRNLMSPGRGDVPGRVRVSHTKSFSSGLADLASRGPNRFRAARRPEMIPCCSPARAARTRPPRIGGTESIMRKPIVNVGTIGHVDTARPR